MKKVLFIAVAAVTLFGVVAGAYALGPVAGDTVSDTVVITAGINSKISITAPADIAYGWKDPDAAADTRSGDVTVWSNVPYALTETPTRNDFPAGVFTWGGADTLDGSVINVAAVDGDTYTRSYTLDPSASATWMSPTAASDSLEADILYTATVK